jgi:uncharacterized protein
VSEGRPALLDVNVLVALAWPTHAGHRAARRWFDEQAASGWATTPVTELGFVRVSSNRRALPGSTSPGIAVTILGQWRALGAHEFWPDDVQLVTDRWADVAGLTGHRQVTDAHLVALALSRQGRVVTFDRGLVALAPANAHIDLLGPV